MSLDRAAFRAVLVAVGVAVVAIFLLNVPVHWAVLIALPAGVVTFGGVTLSGAFDADWTAEPDPTTTSVARHASDLTERLERAAKDRFRFTSRVRPRLRHLALAALGQDLNTEEAREKLGADLHRLLTAPDAQLPDPKTFAALVRRLEDLC
jgi:hypothetical protein